MDKFFLLCATLLFAIFCNYGLTWLYSLNCHFELPGDIMVNRNHRFSRISLIILLILTMLSAFIVDVTSFTYPTHLYLLYFLAVTLYAVVNDEWQGLVNWIFMRPVKLIGFVLLLSMIFVPTKIFMEVLITHFIFTLLGTLAENFLLVLWNFDLIFELSIRPVIAIILCLFYLIKPFIPGIIMLLMQTHFVG